MQQVQARTRLGQNVGDEKTLVDLEAGLVLLKQPALGCDGRPGRKQIREPVGGGVNQLGYPQ